MRKQIFARNSNDFLGIHNIGYSENPLVTRFGPGSRNQYIIHYVLQGEGFYNGNLVCQGQGFLITPNQREHYYPKPENPWHFLWIVATGNQMAQLFPRYNADPQTNIFSFQNLPTLRKAAAYLLENNNKTADALELTELFLHILNSHAQPAAEKHRSNAKVYTDFCMDYIEKNIHKKITVAELTEVLGVSQPYLYKIFNTRFHTSVKAYITQAKHNHAKTLLRTTDLNVTEVANSVGYDDSLSFSKAFKSTEGLSPTQYRQKQ